MTAEADVAEPRREHGEHVRLLTARYDRMAQSYERHWSPVIRPMARPLLAAIAPIPGQRVLDLATGTGALLSDLTDSGAALVGADRSLGMLRIARQRHLAPLVCMDAHDLALVDQSAHVVVAAFVLFHLPDPAQALSEIRRVLEPGGVAAVVTWGEEPTYPANELWLQTLAELPPAPGEVEFYDTRALMDTPRRVTDLLRAAGFDSPRCWARRFTHRWDREQHFQYRLHYGYRWQRLESLEEPARSELIEQLRRQASELPDAAFIYRPRVVYGIARRP